MRQKTRKADTKELQQKAGTVTAVSKKAPIHNREELVSVKAEKIRTGELTIQDFAKELKLTDLQLTFCLEYTKPDCFGDHITAYGKAADLDLTDARSKQLARTGGLQLTKHVACTTLINALLESEGFTAENAKKALVFLMNQFEDKRMKFAASKLFFEMNGQIKNHSEVTVKHQFDYSTLDPEKLELLIQLKQEVLINQGQKPSLDLSKVSGFIEDAVIVDDPPPVPKAPKKAEPKETVEMAPEPPPQEPIEEDEEIDNSDPWEGYEDFD